MEYCTTFVGIHAAWVAVFGRGRRMLPGWVALRMGRSPCGEKRFFFCGKAGCFAFRLVFCLPGWGQNRFFFCKQKRKRFWTPKKKRETSGNDYGLRYNRTKPQPCLVIPWVKSFGLSFYLRRPAFERPVVPLAPLPLSGWNTVTCSLVFTPPGWGERWPGG